MNLKLLFPAETDTDGEDGGMGGVGVTCEEAIPVEEEEVFGDAQIKAAMYRDHGCKRAKRLFGSCVVCKHCPMPDCIESYYDGYRGYNRRQVEQQFQSQGLCISRIGIGVTVRRMVG